MNHYKTFVNTNISTDNNEDASMQQHIKTSFPEYGCYHCRGISMFADHLKVSFSNGLGSSWVVVILFQTIFIFKGEHPVMFLNEKTTKQFLVSVNTTMYHFILS